MNNSKIPPKDKTAGSARENKKRNEWFFWDTDRGGPGYGFWIFIIGMLFVFVGGAVAFVYLWSNQGSDYDYEERESTSALVNDGTFANNAMKEATLKLALDQKYEVFCRDKGWFLRLGTNLYDWDSSQKRWLTPKKKHDFLASA